MKRTICFVMVSFAIISLSCKTHNQEKNCSINSVEKTISELKKQVIECGDSCAYDDLKIQLMDFNYGSEELLPYAMVMANKYDYAQAYYDVFDCLTIPYWSDFSRIDPKTAELAVSYLLVAAEKGDEQASEIVESFSISNKTQDCVELICHIYQ